ncbi:phosphatidylserine decarboxylase-domain-containing protein [Butyriboletus roseoflavus]|nr:phosphatidylserine decarboxylase-domain-containing protein [Butyriboletus roseoflavus]
MSVSSGFTERSLYHTRLPPTPVIHRQFLNDHFSGLSRGGFPAGGYTPAVQAFLKELDKDPINKEEILSLFNVAIEQAQKFSESTRSKTLMISCRSLTKSLVGPPKFYKANIGQDTIVGDPIGVPVYFIFDLISNTPAGYRLLCRNDVNAALKALLTKWGKYLESEASSSALTDKEGGWFSDSALAFLESDLGDLHFDDTYITELEKPQRYKTWDSFFTRKFKQKRPDGKPVRPINPQRGDHSFFIYNPCESTVLCSASDVRSCDTFWIKGKNYSLYEMLGGDEYCDLSNYAKDLEGGAIILSYLAPQDYHRWHSPVAGTVLAAKILDGSYYANDVAVEHVPDFLSGDSNGAHMIRLQPWLNLASTRTVLVIKPTDVNSHIDLIAFILIGMVEVSSCEITYDKRSTPHPEQVEVGTELGIFHFGGSAYALVVKPEKGYKVIFQDVYDSPVKSGQHRWIHSVIAQVRPENQSCVSGSSYDVVL